MLRNLQHNLFGINVMQLYVSGKHKELLGLFIFILFCIILDRDECKWSDMTYSD